MSGGALPYHLRGNKTIDRIIFMEFLEKLGTIMNISEYQYIGFGAVRMEDFKIIHSYFDIKLMQSLEIDNVTYERQLFNKPFDCIKPFCMNSGTFVAEYFSEMNSIIWFDYYSADELGIQINEIHDLLPKLREYDVFKITLNANINRLGEQAKVESADELNSKRLEKLIRKANIDYFPAGVTTNMMNPKDYPKVLLKIIKLTALDALEYTDNLFKPVLSYVYSDSSQMLTITGIILNKENNYSIEQMELDKWDRSTLDWEHYKTINLPDLTLKERLAIDSLMPCSDVDLVAEKLPFRLDRTDRQSKEKIENYIKYYRHYPFFTRASI